MRKSDGSLDNHDEEGYDKYADDFFDTANRKWSDQRLKQRSSIQDASQFQPMVKSSKINRADSTIKAGKSKESASKSSKISTLGLIQINCEYIVNPYSFFQIY